VNKSAKQSDSCMTRTSLLSLKGSKQQEFRGGGTSCHATVADY